MEEVGCSIMTRVVVNRGLVSKKAMIDTIMTVLMVIIWEVVIKEIVIVSEKYCRMENKTCDKFRSLLRKYKLMCQIDYT